MKTKISPAVFILVLLSAFFSSCQDETYMVYTANSPIYMSYEDLRSAVKSETVQPLVKPGKIYFKDNYIFINEYMTGVHVYDNSNPANPQQVAFINIPGNVDIAVRNNYLFADSYIDLVVINIADIQNPVEVDRVQDIFDYTIPEYDTDYELATVDREKGVVLDWEVKEVKELVHHETYYYPIYWEYGYDKMLSGYASNSSGGGTVSGGGTDFGVGGSMARFGQKDKYLYVLNNSYTVSTFEVQSTGDITNRGSWNVGWNVETMFIKDYVMFLGSQNGMFIYDIAEPLNFKQLSQFMHFRACDPVVADDDYAYVTLRTGGGCGSGQNVLEVINIKNLKDPYLEKIYQLENPNGLGIDDEVLFVCDGDDGLKVFDASRPAVELPLLSHFKDIHAYDVIPLGNILFAVGDGGFYMYDYSDLKNIFLLSQIEVVENAE